MVIRFYTIRKLDGSGESPRRNFSFPQMPQILADFFNLKFLLDARPELKSTDNIPRNTASLTSERKNEAESDFLLQVKWLHDFKWYVSARRCLYRTRDKNCACSATFFRCFSIRLKAGLNFWSFFFQKKGRIKRTMVIRFYTIRKLDGSGESPRRNFSFPQMPQNFADFFNPNFF